jgi:hypothetical protein
MTAPAHEYAADLTLEALLLGEAADRSVVRRRPDVIHVLEGCSIAAAVTALSGATAVAHALAGGVLAAAGLAWLVSLSAAGRIQSWQPVGGDADVD